VEYVLSFNAEYTMPKWPVIKEKHQSGAKIYILFIFELDSKLKIIKNKTSAIKEIYSWLPGFCKQMTKSSIRTTKV